MNGRLTGGAKCCLKGCENDAGARKFDSLIGRGGHKPAKGKSSSKSRSDAQRGILKVTPCIVQCSQCRNEICPSSDVPCNKHNINVLKNLFAVPCNFLDEQTGNKTDFHNDK